MRPKSDRHPRWHGLLPDGTANLSDSLRPPSWRDSPTKISLGELEHRLVIMTRPVFRSEQLNCTYEF